MSRRLLTFTSHQLKAPVTQSYRVSSRLLHTKWKGKGRAEQASTATQSVPNRKPSRTMKVAIEGCCHGQLDAIYSHIAELEGRDKYKVDLLLICGDFQAVRNERDLQCMAVPDKYRKLGGFYKYYTGEKKAPMLTIVIGGNHEASNYLWELYHGGWLAPNIYFLGHAGCVQVNGIRIAGASGIFKPHDYHKGHCEQVPYYQGSSIRSIYHIREYNVRRLSLLSSPSIFLSHDWPQSIERHGDVRNLLERKPYFRADIKSGALGSPPMMDLLRSLKPEWWFSAHLHCRFEATVQHGELTQEARGKTVEKSAERTNPDEIVIADDEELGEADTGSSSLAGAPEHVQPSIEESKEPSVFRNPDEILLDDEQEDVVAPPPPPPPPSKTNFLALDKCLPAKKFLEVIDIQSPPGFKRPESAKATDTPVLAFDPEWLAITRAFNPYMSRTVDQLPYPDEAQAREAVRTELEWVKTNILQDEGVVPVDRCQTFEMTAPPPSSESAATKARPPYYPNPQTKAFCAFLGIENKVDVRAVVQSYRGGEMHPGTSE